MPQYDVTAPGFYEGAYYSPGSRRSVVTSDKPLDPIPSWLTPRAVSDAPDFRDEGLVKEIRSSVNAGREHIRDVINSGGSIEIL